MTPDMANAADRIGHEAMQQLYSLIPWGHEFMVGNTPCRIVEMNNKQGKSEPIIRVVDPDNKSIVDNGRPPGPRAYTEVLMTFDVVTDGPAPVDHVEITVKVTGGGGFVPDHEVSP